MKSRKKLIVDDIVFESGGPTVVALDRLYTWVVWQFPRVREGGFTGAVHPPEPGHGWYPALIEPETGQVLVYGHVPERFPSPEAAARHLDRHAA